jgi:pimeloyl-ACP methyl ester carboxylesterase
LIRDPHAEGRLRMNMNSYRTETRCSRTAPQVAVLVLAVLLAGSPIAWGGGDNDWNRLVEPYRDVLAMDGYKLRYIDMGNGEPVIMVHGFADSSYCWHENTQALVEKGFRVILVDLPGLGRSGIPSGKYVFSIENLAASVLKVTNELALPRFSLVGSSMGGGIVLYLASNSSERVRRVAVFAPACFKPRSPFLVRLVGLPGVDRLASGRVGRWFMWLGLRDMYYNDKKVDSKLVDEYARALEKPGYTKVLARLRSEFFSDEFNRMAKGYKQLKLPLLIVWGQNDKRLPVRFGERLHRSVKGSRLVIIENCGHLPHQELPELVNPILTDFLRSAAQRSH